MSRSNFQTVMDKCPAHFRVLEVHYPLVVQVIVHPKIRNSMKNKQPGIVLGMHFVTAGEEKTPSTRTIKRATLW
jgi:hypothetical protein